MSAFFSIITVSLNSGDKLLATMKSVEKQSFSDYEVVIKDGLSKDDSLQQLRSYLQENPEFAARVRIEETADHSIYEGMNQAISYSQGEYLIFMNCGDYFYEADTLQKTADAIKEYTKQESGTATMEYKGQGCGDTIFYGNIFDALRGQVVSPNPRLDAFGCYRNIPCHQSCFYHRSLFQERGYEPKYKVRGDYEHFLWCFFEKKITPVYIPVTIASYEGGGFSETAKNRKRSAEEHKEITEKYMTKGQLFQFKAILLLTLAPLRTKMAESKTFSGLYNKLRRGLYRGR